jgi:hypothetical protein
VYLIFPVHGGMTAIAGVVCSVGKRCCAARKTANEDGWMLKDNSLLCVERSFF